MLLFSTISSKIRTFATPSHSTSFTGTTNKSNFHFRNSLIRLLHIHSSTTYLPASFHSYTSSSQSFSSGHSLINFFSISQTYYSQTFHSLTLHSLFQQKSSVNTATMPNWRTYESSVRLLSAILAAHPTMKLNYDGKHQIFFSSSPQTPPSLLSSSFPYVMCFELKICDPDDLLLCRGREIPWRWCQIQASLGPDEPDESACQSSQSSC